MTSRKLIAAVLLGAFCLVAHWISTSAQVPVLPQFESKPKLEGGSQESTAAEQSDAQRILVQSNTTVPGARMEFAVQADSRTSIQLQGQVRQVQFHITGMWQWTVVAQRDGELAVAACFTDVDGRAQVGDAGQTALPVLAELRSSSWIRMAQDGRVLGYRFDPSMSAVARNWLRTLVDGSRAPVPALGAEWQGEECDASGPVLVQTRWRDGLLHRDKQSLPTQSASRVSGHGELRVRSELPWIEQAVWSESTALTLSKPDLIVNSSVEVRSELREARQVTVSEDFDWQAPWLPASGVDDARVAGQQQQRARDEMNLAGVTTQSLVAQLATAVVQGQDDMTLFELRQKLATLLRLRPAALAELQALMAGLDSNTAELLLGAVAIAGSPAGQQWLAELAVDAAGALPLRLAATRAMFQIEAPQPAMGSAITGLLDRSDTTPELRAASWLVLGAMAARQLPVEPLAQRFALAMQHGQELEWFEAMGNSGSPQMLDWMADHLRHEDPRRRAGAIVALRAVQKPEVTATLTRMAESDADETVRAHAAQELVGRDLPKVEHLLPRETSESVRSAYLRGLLSRAKRSEGARGLVQRMAESDPSTRLRELAGQGLREL